MELLITGAVIVFIVGPILGIIAFISSNKHSSEIFELKKKSKDLEEEVALLRSILSAEISRSFERNQTSPAQTQPSESQEQFSGQLVEKSSDESLSAEAISTETISAKTISAESIPTKATQDVEPEIELEVEPEVESEIVLNVKGFEPVDLDADSLEKTADHEAEQQLEQTTENLSAAATSEPQPEQIYHQDLTTSVPEKDDEFIFVDESKLESELEPELEPDLAVNTNKAELQPTFFAKLTDNWMTWIGAITLSFGGFFLARYIIEMGLFPPAARLCLGGFLGVAMVAGAEFLHRKGIVFEKLSNYTPAAIASAGFVTCFSMVLLAYFTYGFIGSTTAFILSTLVCVGCGLFSFRFGPILAVVSFVGGYLVPALINTGSNNIWGLLIYVGLISLFASYISNKLKIKWLWWFIYVGHFGWYFIATALIIDREITVPYTLSSKINAVYIYAVMSFLAFVWYPVLGLKFSTRTVHSYPFNHLFSPTRSNLLMLVIWLPIIALLFITVGRSLDLSVTLFILLLLIVTSWLVSPLKNSRWDFWMLLPPIVILLCSIIQAESNFAIVTDKMFVLEQLSPLILSIYGFVFMRRYPKRHTFSILAAVSPLLMFMGYFFLTKANTIDGFVSETTLYQYWSVVLIGVVGALSYFSHKDQRILGQGLRDFYAWVMINLSLALVALIWSDGNIFALILAAQFSWLISPLKNTIKDFCVLVGIAVVALLTFSLAFSNHDFVMVTNKIFILNQLAPVILAVYGLRFMSRQPKHHAFSLLTMLMPLLVFAFYYGLTKFSVIEGFATEISLRVYWSFILLGFSGALGYFSSKEQTELTPSLRDFYIWIVINVNLAFVSFMWADGHIFSLLLAAQVLLMSVIKAKVKIALPAIIVKVLMSLLLLRLTFSPWLPEVFEADLFGVHSTLLIYPFCFALFIFAKRYWQDIHVKIWFEGAALHLLALFITTETSYQLLGRYPSLSALDFYEAILLIFNWLLLSAVYLYRSRGQNPLSVVYQYAVLILMAGAASLHVIIFLKDNPFIYPVGLGSNLVINWMLLIWLFPALILLAMAWFIHKYQSELVLKGKSFFNQKFALGLVIASSALMFILVNTEIRHFFQGYLTGKGTLQGNTSDAEMYTYSVVWLIISAAIVIKSSMMNQAIVQKVGLSLLALVTLKVFLIDMSNLEGLLRALSFIGLGASLVALGWLFQRLRAKQLQLDEEPQ